MMTMAHTGLDALGMVSALGEATEFFGLGEILLKKLLNLSLELME